MSSIKEHNPLHIFFFPFLAHGHITPMVDLANLFSSRGLKSTIITTPLNASLIPQTPTSNDVVLHVKTIDLPYGEAGLPYGCENLGRVAQHMIPKFLKATTLLGGPLERAMAESSPDWVVADMMFFPWVARSAAKLGIPTLAFHAVGFFPSCAHECMRSHRPYDDVSSDSEVFVIPGLPGEISMTRIEVADYVMRIEESEMLEILEESHEEESNSNNNVESYGVVVNSFCELEEDYVYYYRNVLGKKAWHIGPLSLYKANRGKEEEHECLKWLDTKKPNSVIYICFGTLSTIPESQLSEISMALEASNQQFIWVVKESKKEEEEEKEKWVLSGFEKRTQGKGLIIRGWAPQVQILEHEAVGAFVTHCGWNSILEAVSAGVPMITWPEYAEQFYNEKLLTQVLRIGVPVGVKKWTRFQRDDIKWDAIEKLVKRIMEGEEAEGMRNRAKVLAHKARVAVQKDGSSYSDFNALIQELAMCCHH
ncbi:scopoletin glucosyltransferase-like [Senna tora]|uniref:Glycosyltransferase n=1 Tax=Senna tora TaxID=362788 RepID=A0A834XAI8_9FABA|nr:scopoletin glucosyltransferase-like [Senna tora]